MAANAAWIPASGPRPAGGGSSIVWKRGAGFGVPGRTLISTVPQKGLGLSVTDLVNPYVKLSGTLAKPSLTLDPEGVLLEGGTAVATAGISILA